MSNRPQVSLIVPLYNEVDSVNEMVSEALGVFDRNDISGELIVIDDGSSDGSWDKLVSCANDDKRVRLIRFRRNFGQTAAMVAGIDYSSGDVIVPMDADLQNDPNSIPLLLEKCDEGYDVVSGWRKDRQDAFISRKLPSRIANALISYVSGVRLHDYGCSLKAYRREVLDPVNLYGEMHRFIPIYASWNGAKVTEVAVNHRARKYGESKYGIGRTFKVILDLIVVKFLGSYGTKPIYFFGGLGFLLCAAGLIAAGVTSYEKIVHDVWVHKNPFLLIFVFLFSLGVQSVFLGLLAEIGTRTYHESQRRPIYVVKERHNMSEPRDRRLRKTGVSSVIVADDEREEVVAAGGS